MVEEILPDIFRIEIPLPKSPLKALNAYVIKSRERSLVVDTGWNRDECLRSMLSGLAEVNIDLDRMDFFITHLHADHMGLVEKLIRKGTTVYLGEIDATVAMSIRRNAKERRDRLCRAYLSHGFPEPELRVAVENHPGFHYGPAVSLDFTTLQEGDRLAIGGNAFRCIETPGHSPGHMCLYDARRKICCQGTISSSISPLISHGGLNWIILLSNTLRA
jgi:glyoxylase-like metal-dependent hydrolase (beta-lactamase superfamily II)